MTDYRYSAIADRQKRLLDPSAKDFVYSAQDELTLKPLSGRQLDGSIRIYSHPASSIEITYKYDERQDEILVQNIGRRVVSFHVFVSYSHVDRKWLHRIRKKLEFLEHVGIRFWADEDLRPGEVWYDILKEQLREARGSLLLVSESFLTSAFICQEELPEILDAVRDGFELLWVAVEAHSEEGDPIAQIARYQAVIDPEPPLGAMGPVKLSEALDAIQDTIVDVLVN